MGDPFAYESGRENATIFNSSLPSNSSNITLSTDVPEKQDWPAGVNIGIPILMVLLFVLVQMIVILVKTKKSPVPIHVPIRLHVSAKSDFEEKPKPVEKKVTISPDEEEVFGEDPHPDEDKDERTIETASDVERMRQHAKEQAKKSRKRQISLKSIASMVSRNSSQFDYSELEEQDMEGGLDNQLVAEPDDESEDEVDTTGAGAEFLDDKSKRDSSVITVMVEHHSPPKHLLVDVSGITSDAFEPESSQDSHL